MFSGTLFIWSAIFVLMAIGLLLFFQWARRNNKPIKWYDLLIGIVGLVIFVFAAQNIVTSFSEGVPSAAGWFTLMLGLPSIVLIGIAMLQIWRRTSTTA